MNTKVGKSAVKSWTEFTSDVLLDDSIEGEEDFIQWPGKNVAQAIAEILNSRGYTVSEPIDVNFKGWELDITSGKRSFTARITLIYKYSVVIWQNRSFNFFNSAWPEFIEITESLAQAMANDTRFQNIQRFTDEEMNKFGANEAILPHQPSKGVTYTVR